MTALTPRVRAEAVRFLRISVLAFLGQLAAFETAGHGLNLGWASLGALAAGAVETAIHQLSPVAAPLPPK